MAFNLEELSADDLRSLDAEKTQEFLDHLKSIANAQKELEQEKVEKGKLLNKRAELLKDIGKLKSVNTAATELGIDLKEEGAEEKLIQLIKKAKQEEPESELEDQDSSKKGVSESKTEYEKAINRLKTQLDTVQTQLATEKKEKEEEQRRNLERMKKDKVLKAMMQNGVTEYPEHLYTLTKDKYRLEGTGEDAEVVGGDEYEPVPLDTILGNLRDNKEYKRYFSGSGLTGSGMTANEQKTAASKNPFRTDNFNQTECSVLLSTDKARAKRLIGEAKAAGKLDATMAKAIAKMSDMN
jgi:hypothetical protein